MCLWWPTNILDLPVVRGCTESLALVKSAMSLRGPPLARCCRWYFFSSERGRKRFIILWYWTSTWERRKQNQQSCLKINIQTFNPWMHLPCSTWGCLVYCWHQSGHLSCQTECGPHTPPSQSRQGKTAKHWGPNAGLFKSSEHYEQEKSGLLSLVLLCLAPCSCYGKRKPTAHLSFAS